MAANQPTRQLGKSLPPNSVLQHFWNLASLSDTARITATHALFCHLSPLHIDFTPSPIALQALASVDLADPKTVLSALAHTLHPHVYYTLTRLVKGLPSSRLAARQGFGLALSMFIRLTRISWVHLKAAMSRLILTAPADSSIDLRESLFAQMFIVLACIESGLVCCASMSDVVDMVTILVDLANAKSYLREAAFSLAFRIVSLTQHKDAVLSTLRTALPTSIDHVDYLALSVFLDLYNVPDLPFTLTLASLSDAVLSELILHAASVAPRLHIIWSVMLAKVLGLSSPIDATLKPVPRVDQDVSLPLLAPFWDLIDRTLLTTLPQRQAAALAVFSALFRSVHVTHLSCFMTANLTRVLDSVATSVASGDTKKSNTHALAPHVQAVMQDVVDIALVDSRVVPVILSSIKPTTIATLLTMLILPFGTSSVESEDGDSGVALSLVDQLLSRLSDTDLDAFIKSLIARAQDDLNRCDEDNESAPCPMSALETLINPYLLSRGNTRSLVSKLILSPKHLSSIANATKRIQNLLARSVPAPELHCDHLYEIYAEFPELNQPLKEWMDLPLRNAESTVERKRELALRSLAMASHLILYSDEQFGSDRVNDMVSEIISVWKRYAQQEEAGDLHPLDVLVDLTLELTSHPVAWLRRLCAVTMDAFAEAMTDTSLELLIGALEDVAGEQDDDLDEMGVDSEEDACDGSDNDDASDESEDDTDDAQSNLSTAILEALSASGIAQTNDDEMDLDDDAMLAIDGMLGLMVKKSNARHQQTERLHFKSRVLDLIGIYFKRRHAIPVVHLRQMADQIAITHDKQLSTKLWSVLSNVKALKVSEEDDCDELDSLTLMFLKGNLGLAHSVVMKLFKAHPPSHSLITDVLLKDIKRYKSILMALARTEPSTCTAVFTTACEMLTRKTVPHLGPLVTTLLERMPSVPELQRVFSASTFVRIFKDEVQGNPKDASLLKVAVAAFRACIKCGFNRDVWRQTVESVTAVPTKQAPLGLLNEARRLLDHAPHSPDVPSENEATPRPNKTNRGLKVSATSPCDTPRRGKPRKSFLSNEVSGATCQDRTPICSKRSGTQSTPVPSKLNRMVHNLEDSPLPKPRKLTLK